MWRGWQLCCLQAINPAVVQLEMLGTVQLAHQHRWGRQPDGVRCSSAQ